MARGERTTRARAPRTRAALAATTLLAGLLPALVAAPAAQASMAVPRSGTLPVGIDASASYQGQSTCSPTPKVGALKLAALLRATYGSFSVGISRPCSDGGQSEHKEGRALDWMVSSRVPGQKARATAFLTWLLAPGADGQPAAMARRLGVMYIGWNDHFWASYRPEAGWTDLKGCSTDPKKRAGGFDTYCHRNHVHLSLSWEGAMAMTSFWTGVALAPPCQSDGGDWGGWGGWTAPGSSPAGEGIDLVPVTPVRVLDTRTGSGLTAPCRLTGAASWDGTRRDVVVHATGAGGVPAAGVSAVAVRVTTYRAVGGTLTVSARTTSGSALIPVTTSPSSVGAAATTVVPVADDGTIRLSVDGGSADLQVDVVGWVPLVVPPAPPADPTPPPDPTPTDPSPTDPPADPADPPADPPTDPTADPTDPPVDPVAPAAGADTVVGGLTHVVTPSLVYDGTARPLAPKETRTVRLSVPVPASGLSGVAVTLTADRTRAATYVGVLSASSPTLVGSLRTSTTAPRATQLLAPSTDGTVVLRNTGAAPVTVRLYANAWFTAVPTGDGATLTTLASPVTVVDSATRLGLSGPVRTGAARLVNLTGAGGAPAGARGVLVSVSALGGTTDGTLSIGSTAPAQAVSFTARQWSHEVVLLPLSASGMLAVRTPSIGTQVRIRVLGYVA